MFAFYILSYILGREDQICLHLKAFKFFLYFTSLFLHILLFLTCVFKRDIVSAWRHVQLCSGAADRISEFAPHYTMSYSYTQLQNTGRKYKTQKIEMQIQVQKSLPLTTQFSTPTLNCKIQEGNTKHKE